MSQSPRQSQRCFIANSHSEYMIHMTPAAVVSPRCMTRPSVTSKIPMTAASSGCSMKTAIALKTELTAQYRLRGRNTSGRVYDVLTNGPERSAVQGAAKVSARRVVMQDVAHAG